MADEPEVSRARVLAGLVENVEIAMGRNPVKRSVWRSGKLIEIEVFEHNPAAAVRALELLGKELGMFKERHEITELSSTSDEQLDAAIKRSLAALEAMRGAAEDSNGDLVKQ
jgi:hypothetical protein